MNRRNLPVFGLLLALLGQALPLAAEARERDEGPRGRSVSSEQAAAIARRAYDGRVVSVQPVGRGGEGGYKVRVLTDGGRVKTVRVDSQGSIRGSD